MDINTGTRPAGSEAMRGSPVAVWVRPGRTGQFLAGSPLRGFNNRIVLVVGADQLLSGQRTHGWTVGQFREVLNKEVM